MRYIGPFLGVCLLAASSVAAQDDEEGLTEAQVIAVVRAIATQADFDEFAEAYQLSDDMRPVVSEHLRLMFANDAVAAAYARHFVTEQWGFGLEAPAEYEEAARILSLGWAHELAALGAARLPVSRQRRVLEAGRTALDRMPEEACAAYTRGALDPAEIARAELKALAEDGETALMAYLALLRAALLAEISDNPPFEPLSDRDKSRAAAAYETAFVAGIEAHPQSTAVRAAVENFDLAPDTAICDLTLISLDAALSVEGETGDLVVRLITSG